MKKPPDIIQENILETPKWFDINFTTNIRYPSNNNHKLIIPSIINSEKFLLNNHFNNYSFIDNIKSFDNIKCTQAYNAKIININNNPTLTEKQKIIKFKSEKTKYTKKIKFNKSISKSIKIKLIFSINQKKQIFEWFKICNKVYNFCVNDYNNNPTKWLNNNQEYMLYKSIVFNNIFGDRNKCCPFDVLTDEVRIFCSNIKSCESNLLNGHIYKYSVRKRFNDNLNKKSILIPSKSINKNGIFSNLLGHNNEDILKKYIDFNNFDEIQDSRLVYDYSTHTFILHLVKKEPMIFPDNRKEFISLDPGERVFNSYFASDSYGFFGKDLHKIYLDIRNKISRWQRILKQNKNKTKGKTAIKNKKRLKRRIQKLYDKIKNITKEMHNKLALYLCRNYKQILLPEFKVKKMVDDKKRFVRRTIKNLKEENIDKDKKEKLLRELIKNKRENRLSRKVKFVLLMQSHYKFRQHLVNKCNEYGCHLEIVTEEHTSVTCSKCGICSKVYKNRVKECKCKSNINRDINGAINILHKNHSTILRRNAKVRERHIR